MRFIEIDQSYQPPVIDVRKATVTGFKTDDHHQPVLRTSKGDQKLFKPRIVKLDHASVKSESAKKTR